MSVVILVPVKESSRAKTRLACLLSPEERRLLVHAMLDDLVRALLPLDAPVAFVTNSAAAAEIARGHRWKVFWEERQISESISVDEASRRLAAEKTSAVLRLPADIPLAQSEDIERLLDFPLKPGSAVLVPSWDKMGTNAVLRRPPHVFPSRFGYNSLVLHSQEALRARAGLEVLELPRLAIDIDDGGDLRRFLEWRSDSATARLLERLRLKERLNSQIEVSHPGV